MFVSCVLCIYQAPSLVLKSVSRFLKNICNFFLLLLINNGFAQSISKKFLLHLKLCVDFRSTAVSSKIPGLLTSVLN